MSEQHKRPPTSVSGRVPRLQSFLDEDRMVLDVKADDLEGAVASLVECLVRKGITTAESAPDLVAKVVARDKVASNAIGLGVACPHAFVDTVTQPLVVFGRLAEPLDLRAPDGRPTDLVFLLVGRKDDAQEHLQLLMHLARLSQDDRFLDGVRRAESPTDVINATLAAEQRIRTPLSQAPNLSRAGIEYRTPRFAGGVIDDIRRRLPHYRDDFISGLRLQSVAAIAFLFFACLTAAVTFGSVMQVETGGAIGAVEMILATAFCGVVFALFGGQPLIILGGTGPLLVFTAILYQLCGPLGIPFLPFYAAVGLWAAAFTILLAVTDASVWIRHLTRFTDEIFVLLIGAIFISEAIRLITKEFQEDANYATALSTLVVAVGTFGIAMLLRHLRRSTLLRQWARNFLADFGSVIAIGTMSVVAYTMRAQTDLPHIAVPEGISFDPRDHVVAIGNLPGWGILLAAIPGVFVAILIFLDQQITGRVVNSPHFNLQKGPGYHLDLLVVGGLTAVCSILGWPWLVAATVRSLNHVSALATTHAMDSPEGPHLVPDRVLENRVTGVGIHVLIGASILLVPLLGMVPMACLYGIFLYMGIASLAGNEFAQRVTLWARDPSLYPPTHYLRRVPLRTVHGFTAIQAACLALLWVVKTSVLAVLFPLVLALLVPIRLFLLPRLFDERHLAALDTEETLEEETDREAAA